MKTSKRTAVIAAWLIAGIFLFPAARRAPDVLEVSARIEGSESAFVDDMLSTEFGSPFARSLIVVISGLPPLADPSGREALKRIVQAVEARPEVIAVLSSLNVQDSTLVGSDGRGILVMVGLAEDAEADQAIPLLRETLASVRSSLHTPHPHLALRVTGEDALNFDLRTASAAEARKAERRVLPLAALLLVLGFGSLGAALLPVVTGAIAIPLALGVAVWISRVEPLSMILLNVVSMIGLGLGIDYALLMVHRWREERGANGERSVRGPVIRATARTITLSGAAVAVGFTALLLVPLNELRSVAVGGLLAAAVSVLLATTLLPTILEAVGYRLEWGRLRFRRGEPSARRNHDLWARWARWVVRHPVLVIGFALPPLAVLSAQSIRLETGLPQGDWLPEMMESAVALKELEAMDRNGLVNLIRIVVELPETESVFGKVGSRAATRVTDVLLAHTNIATVRSVSTLLPPDSPPRLELGSLPERVASGLVAREGRLLQFEAVPSTSDLNALNELVGGLREQGAERLTGLAGTRMWVGGLPAFNSDYRDAVAGRFLAVAGLVVSATFLALVIGFRSVLIPIKAVVLNLLSVAGAFGALVLVFQDGHGAELLGLTSVPGSVFPIIPVLVFCIVFGLSMDYEVFLVSRVAEARRRLGEEEAVVEGLAKTGPVISSAAAIMIVVFGGFTLGDFVLVKMLGFALATAIFLDAAIVRVAIGPALLVLMGRWNWWPGGADFIRKERPPTRLAPTEGQHTDGASEFGSGIPVPRR